VKFEKRRCARDHVWAQPVGTYHTYGRAVAAETQINGATLAPATILNLYNGISYRMKPSYIQIINQASSYVRALDRTPCVRVENRLAGSAPPSAISLFPSLATCLYMRPPLLVTRGHQLFSSFFNLSTAPLLELFQLQLALPRSLLLCLLPS
jgi:hypothetical protein